jgi:hypothetical protein
MTQFHPLFTILAIGYTLTSPLHAEDSICPKPEPSAPTISCQVKDLHPTQFAVGMLEVSSKSDKLAKKERAKKLDAYLRKVKHAEPVVIGPSGIKYITDHHHLAAALSKISYDHTNA